MICPEAFDSNSTCECRDCIVAAQQRQELANQIGYWEYCMELESDGYEFSNHSPTEWLESDLH